MRAHTTFGIKIFEIDILMIFDLLTSPRTLRHLFGNGAGAHGIGKISGIFAKIGKFYIVLMNDVSIARLIPIIKLTLVSYEKREINEQV